MGDEITITSTTDSEAEIRDAFGQEPKTPKEASSEVSKEETESVASPETAEPSREEPEGTKPQEGKPKSRFERRIDQITREKYELAAANERLRQQLGQYEAGRQDRGKATEKPKREDFDTDEDYIEAIADFKVAERLDKHLHEVRQAQLREIRTRAEIEQRAAYETFLTQWQSKIDSAKAKFEDFEAVVRTDDVTITPAMRDAIVDSDLGAEILYFIGKHPEEAKRLSALGPYAATREIGKIEAAISESSSPKPKVSNAPAPIRPVGTRGDKSTKNPDEMDYQEFKAWRMRQIASANGG